MNKQAVRIVHLDPHVFIAPNGMPFIFRFSLEEFVPTELVPIMEQYLGRLTSYAFIPIAQNEPMYAAYDIEDVLPFFMNHIGSDFTLVTRPIDGYGTNTEPEDTKLLGETPSGGVDVPVSEETVPDMSGDAVQAGEVS